MFVHGSSITHTDSSLSSETVNKSYSSIALTGVLTGFCFFTLLSSCAFAGVPFRSPDVNGVFYEFEIEKRSKSHCVDFLNRTMAVPATIDMNGRTYTVLYPLGSGSEGMVFLVEHENKKYVIKYFSHVEDLQQSVEMMQVYVLFGIRAIHVFDRDLESKSVLMEYVKGITVYDYKIYLRRTRQSTDEITAAYEKFRASLKTVLPNDPINEALDTVESNVVIDLDNGELVLIDPW